MNITIAINIVIWRNYNWLFSKIFVRCVYWRVCCFHCRSLWPYKESGRGGYHWFWWRLWRSNQVGLKTITDVLLAICVWLIGSKTTAASCHCLRLPEGLEDVSKVPSLVAELLRREWTEEEVKAALGNNLLRVMKEVEKVSAHTISSLRTKVYSTLVSHWKQMHYVTLYVMWVFNEHWEYKAEFVRMDCK